MHLDNYTVLSDEMAAKLEAEINKASIKYDKEIKQAMVNSHKYISVSYSCEPAEEEKK